MLQKALAILIAISIANAVAVEIGAVKRATDKSGNWLVEQFNLKERGYGAGTSTPEQNAMVIKALCDAPRDYKEASGPFITEPLKMIISKINDDGSVKDIALHEPEALQWILSALKATGNPSYEPLVEKLRARAKASGAPKVPDFDPNQLAPKSASAEDMRIALFAAHYCFEQNKKEIMVDGKNVKWADILGEALTKLQKPNGSFNDNVPATAMALYALELCYKSMK